MYSYRCTFKSTTPIRLTAIFVNRTNLGMKYLDDLVHVFYMNEP